MANGSKPIFSVQICFSLATRAFPVTAVTMRWKMVHVPHIGTSLRTLFGSLPDTGFKGLQGSDFYYEIPWIKFNTLHLSIDFKFSFHLSIDFTIPESSCNTYSRQILRSTAGIWTCPPKRASTTGVTLRGMHRQWQVPPQKHMRWIHKSGGNWVWWNCILNLWPKFWGKGKAFDYLWLSLSKWGKAVRIPKCTGPVQAEWGAWTAVKIRAEAVILPPCIGAVAQVPSSESQSFLHDWIESLLVPVTW